MKSKKMVLGLMLAAMVVLVGFGANAKQVKADSPSVQDCLNIAGQISGLRDLQSAYMTYYSGGVPSPAIDAEIINLYYVGVLYNCW